MQFFCTRQVEKKNEARAWKHSHAFDLVSTFKRFSNFFQWRWDVPRIWKKKSFSEWKTDIRISDNSENSEYICCIDVNTRILSVAENFE